MAEKKFLGEDGLKYLIDKIKDYDATSLALAQGYTDEQVAANKITVDSALSETSTNPVENKTIKAEFQAVQGQLKTLSDQLGTTDLSGFETKTDAAAKLSEAKTYTDTEVSKITSGTIAVAEAEHAGTADSATNATNATNAQNANYANTADSAMSAVNADSATKATQDGKGYVIADTYQTIANATSQHDALQAAIDGKQPAGNYAASDHSHTASEVGAYDKSQIDAALSKKANTSDIPTVPTKVSAFTNDAGYLTAVPSEYVTETELSAKGYLASVPSEYVTESELEAKKYLTSIPSEYVTDSELTAKRYATTSYVDAAEADANKYTDDAIANLLDNDTAAVDSIMELASAMEDNADAIEALRDIAGTKAAASDLIAHTGNKSNPHGVTAEQVGAYTKSEIDSKVSTINSAIDGKAAIATTISGYGITDAYTKSQIDTALSGKQAAGNYATKATTLSGYGIADAYTKSQIDSTISGLNTSIGKKSDTGHGHAISDVSGLQSALDGKQAAGSYAAASHTHDDRYYTESEINSKIDTLNAAINKKMGDFTIEIYNGTSGNPKPVRFASFNYSTCVSEEGIAAKISLVSGHGNGTSYAFLEDVIIRVNHLGGVEVDNFKYYGADAGTYDSAARQYGDIFWLVDETNKIVDFYVLMGQYARVQQTPWKRLTYSSKGTVTQYTSNTVYSSGVKNWANNNEIATKSDIPESADLSVYAKKSEIPTDFYSKSYVDAELAKKATTDSLTSHTNTGDIHVTAAQKTNWTTAYNHSQAAHAPSNAEKNQNAFSNVTVGSTTIAADTTTDTLTLIAGSNVTLTPNATNDSVTIAATDTVYTHPSYTAHNNGFYKVTVDGSGHVSGIANVAKADITALGIPAQDTTYTAGTGISFSGTTINNSGVRSIATGSANGTISVNTDGNTANVAVKGLGSAAYTESTAYASASALTSLSNTVSAQAATIAALEARIAALEALVVPAITDAEIDDICE